MSDTAVHVENLSKIYRLGQIGTGTFSHDLNRWWHRIRNREDPYLKLGEENRRDSKGGNWVWALKDINFEVKQGEVLGIIGKNGAGKSTLLKLLSRVTAPTTGFVKAKGRIASLLEVGTGFHPELSGKENIFLNGAILGMSKQEIRRKFDEIVEFSGVDRYIDTPVKRYSSGMYVRLAFAVAAHLESEILIVDEVLAVGDAEFQKKCLGKMKDVSSKEGRTVLFVSHQMGTIAQLCSHSMLLKNGKVEIFGETGRIIEKYLLPSENSTDFIYTNTEGNRKIYFSLVQPVRSNKQVADEFSFNESIYLECRIEIVQPDNGAQVSVTLQDKFGYFISTSVFNLSELPGDASGKTFYLQMPASIIAPNTYCFRLAVFKMDAEVYDLVENICPVRITDTGSKMAKFEGVNYGQVILDINPLPSLD